MINKENIYAGIFGGFVADALGVPYEFKSRKEMKENPATTMTGYGKYNQPPGSWSDDSSMTLATIDSLTNGVNYDDMMNKFCQWIQEAKYTPCDEVFDYGITTRSALSNYLIDDEDALKCGLTGAHDNGNGSLMRIMPASLYANAKKLSTDKQIEFINNVSSLTHAHKISTASCNIYNFVVQEVLNNPQDDFKELILRGIDKSRKYYDNDEYYYFEGIYGDLFDWDKNNLSSKGYVLFSLEVALYLCYHTDNYQEAVLNAVNLGRDTDTNGLITGGLAALYYGYDSIPDDWIETIIKKEYIELFCDKFYDSLK